VKYIAYKFMAKFLVTLMGNQINPQFLDLFVSIGNGDKTKELLFQCAYNFPGIVYVFGVTRWNDLKELYQKLLKLNEVSIKRTLAYSLHEICKMLGK